MASWFLCRTPELRTGKPMNEWLSIIRKVVERRRTQRRIVTHDPARSGARCFHLRYCTLPQIDPGTQGGAVGKSCFGSDLLQGVRALGRLVRHSQELAGFAADQAPAPSWLFALSNSQGMSSFLAREMRTDFLGSAKRFPGSQTLANRITLSPEAAAKLHKHARKRSGIIA